jgi:hypothetical protein
VPDESEPRFVENSDRGSGAGPDEMVDHRPTPVVDLLRHRRVLVGVLVVTLAVGIGLGFLSGKHTTRSGTSATKTVVRTVTARPAPSSGPYNQLIGTGARCSVQNGHQLQLGLEVRNELDAPVTLASMRVPDAPAINSGRSAVHAGHAASYLVPITASRDTSSASRRPCGSLSPSTL